MRRVLPWVLAGLVGLMTAAAAALGVAASPGTPTVTPAQWVEGVLAKTTQAGSAQFTYVQVTTSPNPDLRSTRRGNGAVDFSRADVRVTESDHDIEFEGMPSRPMRPVPSVTSLEQIGVGPVTYERFFPAGLGREFTRLHFGFRKLPFPRQPRAELGLSLALNAAVALGGLEGTQPVVAVRDLGRATVDGQETTVYVAHTAPAAVCPSARKTAPVSTEGPTVLWVDDRGRLVQARGSSHFQRSFAGARPHVARVRTIPDRAHHHDRHADVLGVRCPGAHRRSAAECDGPGVRVVDGLRVHHRRPRVRVEMTS